MSYLLPRFPALFQYVLHRGETLCENITSYDHQKLFLHHGSEYCDSSLLSNRCIWPGSLHPRAISGFLYSALALSLHLSCTGKMKWVN